MARVLRDDLLSLTVGGVTPPVPEVTPISVKPCAIVGTPTVGQPISVQNGIWKRATGGVTATIMKGGVAVGGAYTPVEADVGAIFTVQEVATNAHGSYTVVSRPAPAAQASGTDTTAPTITSGGTFSQPENSAFSTTLTASEPVTWAIVGGADAGLFTLTGATLGLAARDFEVPGDTPESGSNTYIVQIRATDSAGNQSLQTITVTITDVAEGGGAGAVFFDDTFTPASGTNEAITARSSDSGATWASHTAGTSNGGNIRIGAAGRTYLNTGFPAMVVASAVPASADYDVTGIFRRDTSSNNALVQVAGRLDPVAVTTYVLSYNNGSGTWAIIKMVAGTSATLGTFTQAITVGAEVTATLRMRGSSIKAIIGGVEQISVTDADVGAVGRAGIRYSGATQAEANGTGLTRLTGTGA